MTEVSIKLPLYGIVIFLWLALVYYHDPYQRHLLFERTEDDVYSA
jgi:hypothetical protein